MDSDAFLDQEYENLNDAILRAILASKDVQEILARFKNQGQMNEKAVLNLFLSLDEMQQMIDENTTDPADYKLEPGNKISTPVRKKEEKEEPTPKEQTVIDGKLLTMNEVLFEKFYEGKFDESGWLKKARIKF